jgi:hypothetical protein
VHLSQIRIPIAAHIAHREPELESTERAENRIEAAERTEKDDICDLEELRLGMECCLRRPGVSKGNCMLSGRGGKSAAVITKDQQQPDLVKEWPPASP